jgi:hypothetical protein
MTSDEFTTFTEPEDSMEDQWREIIDAEWPGGRPAPKAREAVLGMVKRCVAVNDAAEGRGNKLEMADVVGRFLTVLDDIRINPRMLLDCMRFCFNLCETSQTAIAEHHGVGRAAVSSICVKLCHRFGIPPGRGMKSEEARETYQVRELKAAASGTRAKRVAPDDFDFNTLLEAYEQPTE